MKFSQRSRTMLSYQKTHAKLLEFKIAKENYPAFAFSSNDLMFVSVYILSRYSVAVIDKDVKMIEELYTELDFVSQYYDAIFKSEDWRQYSTDILISGATAYFFAGNYGSAKVLCSKVHDYPTHGSALSILLELYNFVLNGIPFSTSSSVSSENSEISDELQKVFVAGQNGNSLLEVLSQYRSKVYWADEPIDIFYVDILSAIVRISMENSSWILFPEYSGIDKSLWKDYLLRNDAMKVLWPAQRIIGEYGVYNGNNAIIQLPTGVGKTSSIEIIIRSSFLSQRSNTAIIVAPLRALCNEITNDMTDAFLEENVVINRLSDVLEDDFASLLDLVEVKNDKRIFVCTPEKLNYMIHHVVGVIDKVDLFLFDEAHMFDEGVRGARYELLLTEICRYLTEKKQLILLSAVLSNIEDVRKWLFGDNGEIISSSRIKSTSKSLGLVSNNRTIYYMREDLSDIDFFLPRSIDIITLNKRTRESKVRNFPDMEQNSSTDLALYYSIRLSSNGGAAIYVGRTSMVQKLADRLIEIQDRGYDITRLLDKTDADEAHKMSNFFAIYYGPDHSYVTASIIGLLPHYSDLPNGIRLAVEYAFKKDKYRLIACTATLAQGVNLPIKYLIFTNFQAGRNLIEKKSFLNLVGRTARAGMHTEGSIIVTDTKLYDDRNDRRHGGNYRWKDKINLFDSSVSYASGSSLLSLVQDIHVNNQYSIDASCVFSFIIDNFKERRPFERFHSSFFQKQNAEINDNMENNIRTELRNRDEIMEVLENHLAFVISQHGVDDLLSLTDTICMRTLAYELASDKEKERLMELFHILTEKIKACKFKEFVGRSMLGLDQAETILDWMNKNNLCSIDYNEDKLLELSISLYYDLYDEKFSEDQFLQLCQDWINGKMFWQMKRERMDDSKLSEIERICSRSISYKLSFLIGNIIDLIEIAEGELDPSGKLNLLQNKIKYGVSTATEITICEELFCDRYLAHEIENIFENEYVDSRIIRNYIKRFKEPIKNLLMECPSYFIFQLKQYLRD